MKGYLNTMIVYVPDSSLYIFFSIYTSKSIYYKLDRYSANWYIFFSIILYTSKSTIKLDRYSANWYIFHGPFPIA